MIDRAQAEDKPMTEAMSRDERIRTAAYHRYQARCESQAEGDESTDWADAAAQIDAEDAAA